MSPSRNRHGRRGRGPLAACLLLALALPMVASAQGNNAIYRWDSTWPKLSGAAKTEFFKYEGLSVCIDQSGRILCGHDATRPIMVLDADGRFLGSWGQGIVGEPHGMRTGPDGSIWVVDRDRQQILKFTPNGKLLATYGGFGTPGTRPDRFNQPTDIAFGPNGDLYVSDGYKNSRVVQLTSDLKFVRAWGRKGSAPGQFDVPHSIATDPDGNVWVADRDNQRIQIFTADGKFKRQWRMRSHPGSLWITADGRVFVANLWEETISVYTLDHTLIGTFGGKRRERPPGAMAQPHMLTVDDEGRIYEGELRGHRWQRWIPNQ